MSLPRPFDHLVLAARDLGGQAALYRRLGFQVGPRNTHPFGTQNHIIQLDGVFLELIGMGQGADAGPVHPKPGQFSFGGFVGQYLARSEGLAMLALGTLDAKADAAAYAALGIGAFDVFDFGRMTIRPDGSAADLAFTLAFAQSSLIGDAGFFTCQHHHPENFWNSTFQVHPNSAESLKSVVILAENPADHAEFLTGLTGQRAVLSTSMGIEIDTGAGRIEVLTPLAGQFRYGIPLGNDRAAATGFAAFRVGVAQPEALRACLAHSAIPTICTGDTTRVAAGEACGVTIIFEPT